MPKTQSPSLGLCLICKDYAEIERIIKLHGQYFDEIYVQVNGGGKIPSEVPQNVHISTFKWVKDFSKARNALLKQVKTDFWLWVDSDDTILGAENLREVIQTMEAEQLDAAYFQYQYGYNQQGEVIALHWRERLIRTAHRFKWVGAVHETLLSDNQPNGVKDDRVIIKHIYKDEDDMMASAVRNHEILEKAALDNDDPRDLFYLGRSYFMMKDYTKAAQTLLGYTEVSGWDEQKYDAWMKIGDCLLMMDEIDKAINANLEAIKLNPGWPDAYLKMGDLYLHLEQPGRAIEWLKAGLSKPQPETLEIVDPTLYSYRPLVSLALCYFSMARVNEAKKHIDQAAKYKPKSKQFISAYNAVTSAHLEEQTIKSAAWLGRLVEDQGKVKEYIDGLPPFIRNDLRLRPLRIQAYPPKKWPDKSIVFYCGEQWEEWGWDFMASKGAGGSEEAVTYLSEELAKLGWQVTIYNQRVEEYTSPAGVNWMPWETFNPEDEFDVFVAWRNPWMCQKLKIKARVRAVDMHDTPVGHQAMPDKALAHLDRVFLKGDYQFRLAETPIPKEKAVIISNGIVPEQFTNKGLKRNPKKVIYASSADRGLEVLTRQVLAEVKEAVPDVEVVWAYGWDSYDGMHKGNSTKGKWKWELKRDMFKQDVKELGRLSHDDLAKEMMTCGVWAYPTYFPEINCITAIKAQAAGVEPITSGYAALQETVIQKKEESVEMIHTKPEELKKFTDRLIYALKNPLPDSEREQMSQEAIKRFSWESVAKVWDEALL